MAALAATGAFAQSTVSIQGIMDANVQSGSQYGQSYSLIGQSGARTTSIRFHGTEDMGKGLKANFRFEVQPSVIAGDGNGFNNAIVGTAGVAAVSANGTANATGQASAQSGLVGKGYSCVGVSGGFGEVQFGTINTASLAAYLNGSGAFGTGVGSAYGVVQGSTGTNTFTRFENSVAYMTPSFNGFSARFQTALGNDSQYGATTGVTLRRSGMQELGLSYAAGPLSVNFAQLEVKTSPNEATSTAATSLANGSNVTTKTTTASVGYNMGVVRLGAAISNIKNDGGVTGTGLSGATETKSHLLTATMPMGASRLMVSIGERKTDASPVTALEGKKTTFTGLAAEHDLSKRTFVYARYQAGKAGDANAASIVVNGAAGSAGQLTDTKFNLLAVGVSHAF